MRAIAKFFELNESELDGGAATLVGLPFKIFWGFIYFMIFSWTSSRSGRAFLFAVPAMIGFGGFIALLVAIDYIGDSKAIKVPRGYFKLYADPASPVYDPPAARLVATKAVNESIFVPEDKYNLGIAYQINNETSRAVDIMKLISPLEDTPHVEAVKGYVDGHLWLSSYYGLLETELSDEEKRSLALQHLELAVKIDPVNVQAILGLGSIARTDANELKLKIEELPSDSPEANELNAELETKTQDAIDYFQKAVAQDLVNIYQLHAHSEIIELLQEQGKDEAARIHGNQFRNNHIRYPRDQPDFIPFWTSIVNSCILIGDFERGQSLIAEGIQIAQDNKTRLTLYALNAELEIEKSKTFEDMDDENEFLERLFALAKAVRTNVRSPSGYRELVYYVDGFEKDKPQDFWLRDSILEVGDGRDNEFDSNLPGVLHVVVGMRDVINGDLEYGKSHWETAGQQFVHSVPAINFLIGHYCEEREVTDEKKFELISSVIDMFPNEPIFRLTRGSYLVAAEDFEKAIDDFEFANARLPASLGLSENLLECYEKTNNSEKANLISKKIAELRVEKLRDEISTGFSSQRLQFKKDKEDEEEE